MQLEKLTLPLAYALRVPEEKKLELTASLAALSTGITILRGSWKVREK